MRQRTSWEQTRWQTFWLLHNGMLDCAKAGIRTPTDLIKFPWDNESAEESDTPDNPEEIERLRKEMQEFNRKIEAQKAKAKQ